MCCLGRWVSFSTPHAFFPFFLSRLKAHKQKVFYFPHNALSHSIDDPLVYERQNIQSNYPTEKQLILRSNCFCDIYSTISERLGAHHKWFWIATLPHFTESVLIEEEHTENWFSISFLTFLLRRWGNSRAKLSERAIAMRMIECDDAMREPEKEELENFTEAFDGDESASDSFETD